MKKTILFILIAIFLVLNVGDSSMATDSGINSEKEQIKEVVHNSIGWAMEKDKDLLLNSVARDSNFFIYHPDNKSTIVGYESFRDLVENVFMHPAFKATGYEINDLRINVSKSGEAAWYSARLNDRGEWNGQPTSWENVRWTGVLEKRSGKWIIVQMHFSFASDADSDEEAEE
jgi:hypothetical protein